MARPEWGRGRLLSQAVVILIWLGERTGREFRPYQLADHLGVSRRTAYRWLAELEASGFVEVTPTKGPDRYQNLCRYVSKAEPLRRREGNGVGTLREDDRE